MSEELPSKKSHPYLKSFLIGSCIGLLASIVFGLITYPWDNPRFEGRAGYHMLAMILLTPVLTLGTGFLAMFIRAIKSEEK